jgi:hypothetical protein
VTWGASAFVFLQRVATFPISSNARECIKKTKRDAMPRQAAISGPQMLSLKCGPRGPNLTPFERFRKIRLAPPSTAESQLNKRACRRVIKFCSVFLIGFTVYSAFPSSTAATQAREGYLNGIPNDPSFFPDRGVAAITRACPGVQSDRHQHFHRTMGGPDGGSTGRAYKI